MNAVGEGPVVMVKGGSPEVLVTPGLGGWVSLGPYFFSDIEKILYFWVYLYTFGTFWAQELDK